MRVKVSEVAFTASGVPPTTNDSPSSSFTNIVKLLGCLVLAVGTISLLSFNIIDVDALFGEFLIQIFHMDVLGTNRQIIIQLNYVARSLQLRTCVMKNELRIDSLISNSN